MSKQYVTKVESEENGGLVILFPDELIKSLNWIPGDLLCWTVLQDGNGFLITKVQPPAKASE